MNVLNSEAAQVSLYLVRLRSAFRFNYRHNNMDSITIHINQMRGVFSTREAAQNFIQTYAPVDVNPFAVFFGPSIRENLISLCHDEVEDEGFDDDGYVLKSSYINENGNHVDEMVDAASTETSFQDFADLCLQSGVTPPDLPSFSPLILWNKEQERRKYMEELLPRWWEETKNSMTDAQKAAIWRKLHPRPYEIVPVPLEREG